MIPDFVVEQIEIKYSHLIPFLNERSRRLWAATEASALGYGGILAVHRATRLSQNTIRTGLEELKKESTSLPSADRIRKSGGGLKRVEEREPSILEALDSLVEPSSRGEDRMPFALDVQKRQSTCQCLTGASVFSLCDDGLHLVDRNGLQFAEQSRIRWKISSIRSVTLSFNTSLNRLKLSKVGIVQ